jgi:hypothetical protein
MVKRKHSLLSKKIDIIFLILSPIFASVTSLYFKTNFLTSTFLFFGIPAIYLSLRNQRAVKKSTIFSILAIMIIGPFLDYIALKSNAWYVPSTVFPMRFFGIVPIEDMIWGMFLVYNIVMMYEHFLDKGKHNLKDTNLKYFIFIMIFIAIIFFLFYYFNPNLLVVPFFYLKFGLGFVVLPAVSFLTFFPRLLSKFVKISIYIFIQGIMFELTGLSLNHWGFGGGEYIGWISLGNIRFPLEELVFYIILFATCVLSYYEFFDDDRK